MPEMMMVVAGPCPPVGAVGATMTKTHWTLRLQSSLLEVVVVVRAVMLDMLLLKAERMRVLPPLPQK